jgi:hypothetical protein
VESLRPVVDRFVSWPADVLRPTTSLQARLALRIAEETGKQPAAAAGWAVVRAGWQQVAPGIECKLLATDTERHRVSMLVRLAPGARYPAHTHAGVEELHLLDGELWIDERKLFPGGYNHGAPGAGDERVWARQAAPAFSAPAPTTFCADHGEPLPHHALRLAGIDRVAFGMHACHDAVRRARLASCDGLGEEGHMIQSLGGMSVWSSKTKSSSA